MLHFSIRDLLLITAVVALATGWFVERRQLDFARLKAESESAGHLAERAKVESLLSGRSREMEQLHAALGEHGVNIYIRSGLVKVGPDSAFADDPLKVYVPAIELEKKLNSEGGYQPRPHVDP